MKRAYEVMAVIRRPRFGWHTDYRALVLSFETYVDEARAAHQTLDLTQTTELLRVTKVSDVKDLDGKTVWVDVSKPGLIIYTRGTGI